METRLGQHSARRWSDHRTQRWLTIVLTLFGGIFPMVVITYYAKTLWIGAPIDSPLILVPSVWIGDSIFLPILNYRIVEFFQFYSTDNFPRRRGIVAIIIIALTSSVAIAGYSHYMWTQDQYLGFIDTSFGTLSPAGWWHLGFTIVQMTIVFSFILFWKKAAADSMATTAYTSGHKAWTAFLWYALVSIVDFSVLHLYTLPRRPMRDYAWSTAWEGLLVIPFWLVVKTYMRIVKARSHY